ncbi:MAG: ATP-binding cassette domain-containing protein [Candidatus Ancillula sp.]|jgi:putative ABC transport system ATP-binding protein|nr:ATP-binding cassette domain-containing protein [Candidatus Ancillula sp.]
MLRLENLSKSFGEKVIWKNLTAVFDTGELIALTGKSGTGKTTLLNCIGLLESVNSGKIYYSNVDVTSINSAKRQKYYQGEVGFLFQNYGLVDDMTISENLDIALKFKKLNKVQREKAMRSALNKLQIQNGLNTRIYTLSGGEQQRVALAKLLLRKPKLILVDEPSAALDITNTINALEILGSFADYGATVIIATHDPVVVEKCQTVYEITGASLVRNG